MSNKDKDAIIEQLREEVERLEGLVYAPGRWKCVKCNFTLLQLNLNAASGTVTARDEAGDACPNCNSPLWRVSWKQEAEENLTMAETQFDRAMTAEAERDAQKARADKAESDLVLRSEALVDAFNLISESDAREAPKSQDQAMTTPPHIEEIARAMCKADGRHPDAQTIIGVAKWELYTNKATLAFNMSAEVCAKVAQAVATDQQDVLPNLAAGIRSGANTAAYRIRALASEEG